MTVFISAVSVSFPDGRTSHYSQRADWACDSGRRVSVRATFAEPTAARAGLVIRRNGLCARPRVADLGRSAQSMLRERLFRRKKKSRVLAPVLKEILRVLAEFES